ncbi:hypothetical protein VUJ46_20070 [Chryseobacterium sp. MYb264]|uniref:hypothetical protein n=1 Tax=Chryseobacterium sp. MYb264 TaxID=2745153 RepID=UPI002E13B50E|nr:hypothetical protein VUJ46_20070 [Chryseobacterium sp. MYb264]
MKKIVIFIWLSIFIQCQTQNIKNTIIDSRFEVFDRNLDKSRVDKIDGLTHIIYTGGETGYSEVGYNTNHYFMYVKNFYSSKNIENKGWAFNQGAPVGIWYYFDEKGKLIKEENKDEGYSFTPEDIIKYCKKNNIELSKGYHERDGYQTSVYKNELDGKKVWLISYLASLNKQEKEVKLTLDGQTGKVIKREEFPYDSY